MIIKTRVLVVALALAAFPLAASAQRAWSVGLGGGASFPLGRFSEGSTTGWHGLATLGWSTLMQPIGVRLDGQYNQFAAEAAGPDISIASATLNLSYRLPMTNSAFSPYIIGGGGAYWFQCVGDADCGTDTRVGWNAGLGTKWVGFGLRGFLESRWHAVNSDGGNFRFVPITFGLTF